MKLALERQIPLAFGLALILLIVIAGISYRTMTHLLSALDRADHTQDVIVQIEEVLISAISIETGARGFALTGDEEFLDPYEKGKQLLPQQMERLRQMTADNLNQQRRLDALEKLASRRLGLANDLIQKRRQEGLTAAGVAASGESVRLIMEQLRLVISEMREEELRLLQQREGILNATVSNTLTIILISSLGGIAALALANVAILRETTKRRAAERSLQIANEGLEHKVAERTEALSQRNEELQAQVIARELAEAAERQQREWWRVTLTSVGDAVITTDRDGRVNFINRTAEELTGWDADEAVGQPLTQVFHIINEETHQVAESPITRVLKEGVVVGLANHTAMITKEGSEIPIDDSGAPIRNDRGEIIGAVLIFREVSKQRQLEVERNQLLAREQAARRQAEDANRMKDEFVATVSHELRAPLNAILGWARMLRAGKLDAEAKTKAMETIERSAENQARLIEDLLDISRIVAGNLRLEVRTLDPVNVIKAAMETVRPAADAKNIHIVGDFEASASAVSGDFNRLQQVIWNLLSNAIKFTHRGGKIQIQTARDESQVLITIRDNGQGIAPEFLPYVFDRFRQADSSSVRKHGGLGLGLAIVRHLVEMHGGQVRAESEGKGKGATFIVRLPIIPMRIDAAQPAAAQPTASWQRQTQVEPILDGLTILVLDDEEDARQLIKQVLTSYGAHIVTVQEASEALAQLTEQRFDLLVSDIGMPGEDGYSLIRKVRTLPAEKNGRIPAIALTAYARAQDRMRAFAAGFQHHVPKPVEPVELATVIASLTGRLNKPS